MIGQVSVDTRWGESRDLNQSMEHPNYCTKTDQHHHHHHLRQASLSFNEYLRLVSCQRRADPDETTLLAVFEWDTVIIIVLMIIVITIIVLLIITIILSTAGLLTQRTRAAYQRSNFARSWAVRWIPFKSSPASWILLDVFAQQCEFHRCLLPLKSLNTRMKTMHSNQKKYLSHYENDALHP